MTPEGLLNPSTFLCLCCHHLHPTPTPSHANNFRASRQPLLGSLSNQIPALQPEGDLSINMILLPPWLNLLQQFPLPLKINTKILMLWAECVLPKFILWSHIPPSTPECDRVFKEVIQLKWGIRVGPNLIWLVSLWEMWTQSGSGKATWRPKEKTDTYKPRGGLGRSGPWQHLDLELPVPKMWENVFLLFKPHRLCSFAMAAQANEFISVWLQSPPWLVGSF